SKAPSVQYCAVTLTPIFLAVVLNAVARSMVSLTALIPCSVKCMVVMKVAIAIFPPGETVMNGAIVSRLFGRGVQWRPARVRSWAAHLGCGSGYNGHCRIAHLGRQQAKNPGRGEGVRGGKDEGRADLSHYGAASCLCYCRRR